MSKPNDQKYLVDQLCDELLDTGEYDIQAIDMLDALACAGLKIERIGVNDRNVASEAYMYEIAKTT